jgi:hypothetical protein
MWRPVARGCHHATPACQPGPLSSCVRPDWGPKSVSESEAVGHRRRTRRQISVGGGGGTHASRLGLEFAGEGRRRWG